MIEAALRSREDFTCIMVNWEETCGKAINKSQASWELELPQKQRTEATKGARYVIAFADH
jgi:hypothetical protein